MNKAISSICAAIAALLALTLPARGGEGASSAGVNFQRLTVEDGLSQGSVTALLQDHRGFLWIGTHDGLNRFDGVEFRVFRHVPIDSTTLNNSWITALHEDASGSLWVGTNEGLNRFDAATETFASYGSGSGTLVRTIQSVGLGGKPMLLVGAESLLVFDPEKRSFTAALSQVGERKRGLVVNTLLKDSLGVIWGAGEGTVIRFSLGDSLRWDARTLGERGIPKRFVLLAPSSGRGPILLGCSTGLYHYHPEQDLLVPIDTLPVAALLRDKSGNVWIGTNRGVGLLGGEGDAGGAVSLLRSDPTTVTSLSNGFVTTMIEDAAGSVWVGTLDGLNRTDRFSSGFSLLRHVQGNPNSLGSNFVLPIMEAADGALWFGTLGSGVSVLRRSGSSGMEFTHLRHNRRPGERASADIVRALAQDGDGRVWIGGSDGLQVHDPGTGQSQSYRFLPPGDTAAFWTNALLSARDGSVWAATNRLVKISRSAAAPPPGDRSTPHREEFFDRERGLHFTMYRLTAAPGAVLNTLFEDEQGTIWIGTDMGLVGFNPRTESFTALHRHRKSDPSSLSNDNVWCLAMDPAEQQGILWVGTSLGLNAFRRDAGSFTAYLEQEGFPNSCVYGILIDGRRRLWLSSNRGVTCFDPSREDGAMFKNFDVSDGIQGNEFNRQSYCKLRDGTFVFGGTRGVTLFDPLSIQSNPYAPPVVLTGFLKMGSRVVFDRAVSDVTDIEFDHDEAAVTFEFAGLSFPKGQKNRYAYRMEGLESAWIDNGTRRYVSYAALAPGSYVFRVKASNSDGRWNETGLAVAVTVRPAFWQTWWFRSLAATLVAGVLFLIVRERERRRAEIERLRLRIAHDLHDEIGGNLTGIAVAGTLLDRALPPGDGGRRKAAEIVDTAVMTAQLIRDLVWIINPENDSYEDLCFRMKDVGMSMLGDKKVAFDFPEDPPRRQLGLDLKRNVLLAYKEILNNIARHSGATEVLITVGRSTHTFELTVSDNGIGFDLEAAQPGVGIRSMQARAASLQGSLRIHSGRGTGTQVELKLPIT